MKKILIISVSVLMIVLGYLLIFKNIPFTSPREIGDAVDSLDGVVVYYNGNISNTSGRNLTEDNYNLGKKYQCVEFVKRYYYQHFHHKMPESYGNAKDFFEKGLKDGQFNKRRDLIQFTNPSASKPEKGDLIIFGGTVFNEYGHVAIISKVENDDIEIIQQNPGPDSPSRVKFNLEKVNNNWVVKNGRILGWLRKKD